MEPNEFELATTEELVAELLRRPTFRGLIIRQKESFKGQPLAAWRWNGRNCDPVEVLNEALARMKDAS